MARYSEELKATIRDANNIVDVIGQFVHLEKKGANYFGLCPFHGEKTASFSVNPRKQICYCFGCHKGGDVISFIMEYEHLSYPEALRYLAGRANIALPEGKETAEEQRRHQLKDRLLEIQKEAAYFYHDKLVSPEGETGRAYFLDQRKLSPRTITHFGLGYAGKKPGELYRFLKDKGFSDQELKESGLFTIEETGAKDKFWNRVMFPIIDINGKVIAFGGRVLGDGLPKYLNSPETAIFDKSSVLYGLNFARRTREKELLLCEGYMDVIALHQSGFTNAVASLGTAFTERHAKLLKRYTDTVVLTQDSDEAGIRAKIRAFPILHDAGLKVKILDLSPCKDPDEFIKANGPDAFREAVLKSRNAFLCIVDLIKRNYDLSDPAQKTDYIREIAGMLAQFRDDMERINYIQSVCAEQMIGYPELLSCVEQKLAPGSGGSYPSVSAGRTPSPAAGSGRPDRKAERSENLLLYWLDARPDLSEKLAGLIGPSDFSAGTRRDLAEKLLQEHRGFDPAAYLDGIDEEESRQIALEIFCGGSGTPEGEEDDGASLAKLLTEAVRNIRLSGIEQRLHAEGLSLTGYQKLLEEKKSIKSLTVTI